MTLRYLVPFLLLAAAISARAQRPPNTEPSIPEPTALATVAASPDTQIVWTQAIGNLQGADPTDSSVAVAAVEMIDQQGEVLRGAIVSLSSPDSTDKLYLGETELQLVQDELAELAAILESEGNTECEAINICVMGIARCRPSQSVIQAYCPGIYSTPSSKTGFALATPRQSFRFPKFALRGLMVLLIAATSTISERSQADAVGS